MKNSNLSALHTVELTTEESALIHGGLTWVGFFVTYVVVMALMNPQEHIDAFVQGVKDGYAAVHNATHE